MKANLESIEIILFDLGGVLINIDYNATSLEMKKLGFLSFDDQYSQLAQNTLFDLMETGKISEQAFINELKTQVNPDVTPNQLVHAWNKMIGKFPQKKVDLLEKLKGRRVAMLSNTNAIHWKKVLQEWKKVSQVEMEEYFEKIFLSHEIGRRKPHVETFNYICQRLKVLPEKVLFIDDSPQHIKVAKEAGLRTFFYEDESSFFQLFS
ncbi:MAG: HAD family hydrolase [Crocinitomicaceae bacterium]